MIMRTAIARHPFGHGAVLVWTIGRVHFDNAYSDFPPNLTWNLPQLGALPLFGPTAFFVGFGDAGFAGGAFCRPLHFILGADITRQSPAGTPSLGNSAFGTKGVVCSLGYWGFVDGHGIASLLSWSGLQTREPRWARLRVGCDIRTGSLEICPDQCQQRRDRIAHWSH
jgi:hypothetical protein